MNINNRQTYINNHNQTGKKIKNYIYNYSEMIGRGNFAKVYRGLNTINQQVVAIKMISLDELKSKKLEQLVFQEIKILQQMNHQNILKFYQALLSDRNCYIVTQLCNEGNLQQKIKKNNFLSQQELGKIILDIYNGLKYLRQMGVTHRDLKTANIFLHNGVAKIADFGLAKLYKQKFKDLDIGSPLYMSPQGLIYNVYGQKTDIWAFGIIIYQLLHGQTPFCHCVSEMDLKNTICKPIPQNKFRKDINPLLRQLINNLLQINDNKRPNIFELINEPYFRNLINLPIIKSINSNEINSTRKKSLIDVQSKSGLKSQRSTQPNISQLLDDKANFQVKKVNMMIPRIAQGNLKSTNETHEIKPLKGNQFKLFQTKNLQQHNMGINTQRLNYIQKFENNPSNLMNKGNNQINYLHFRQNQNISNNQIMINQSITHRQNLDKINKSTSSLSIPQKFITFNKTLNQSFMRRQHSDKTIQTKESNEQKHLIQNGKLQRPKSVYLN